MAQGSSISAHVIKLHVYVQRLESLGVPFPKEFGTDLILNSLPPSIDGFVMNFNMQGMNKSLTDLLAMLKVTEKDIQKNTNHVMMVKKTTQFNKGNNKKRIEEHRAKKGKTPE